MGVKGRGGSRAHCEVHGFKGLMSRRSQQVSKVLGRQGFPCEVHGFKVEYVKVFKVSKALGRQVSKVEEIQGQL